MVIWSKPAQNDLKEIYQFIARDSAFYAQKVILDIVESSENLANFPKMGRVVPEIADIAVREIFVYSYRLIYEIKKDKITVLALVHSKEKFLN